MSYVPVVMPSIIRNIKLIINRLNHIHAIAMAAYFIHLSHFLYFVSSQAAVIMMNQCTIRYINATRDNIPSARFIILFIIHNVLFNAVLCCVISLSLSTIQARV